MPLTVAIIGRPNVGKSTLFNRLAGRRLAIVHDTPGVTRDRRAAPARLGDLEFTVVDTAGLDDAGADHLEARTLAQTARAVGEADVALLLIDARAGVTPLDEQFADRFRRSATPLILVANKCEGRAGTPGLFESYGLGLGEPVALSAEHGDGLDELYAALAPFVDAEQLTADARSEKAEGELETDDDVEDGPLRLAVVGRPNVGKSTLVNALLGDERVVTGPEAGITRDAVAVDWTFRGRAFVLVDTAGLRRKAKVVASLENLAVAESLRAIRFAHVVVLVLDATAGIEKQDLTIARTIVEEGRAPVIALNKWDLVGDRSRARAGVADRLETSLPQGRGIRLVLLSALTGKGVGRLLPAVLETYDTWTKRIATGVLNRWLATATERHPPPLFRGRRIKLRYITQAKARPPTFVVFASQPKGLGEGYVRYLANGLRDDFGLAGVPIRIFARAGRNPYAP